MSQAKRNAFWALSLFTLCLVLIGISKGIGVGAWISGKTIAFRVNELTKKQVAEARAEVVELLKAAPQMDPEGLKRASETAFKAKQLDVAGFFAYAWQARYQMDLALWDASRKGDRQIVYMPEMYGIWIRGGKPNAIRSLEEHPADYIAAIDRFMNWQPHFNADEYPVTKYPEAKADLARDPRAAAVLQEFHTALKRLADSYSNPEFARVASAYARARNQVSFDELHKYTPLMLDANWTFAPETRWHNRAKLNASDYFDDPGSLALCRAIEVDDIHEMERLITDGVDVNRVGKGGMTALLWAMPDYRLKRFECLLRHGANPNLALDSEFEETHHPFYLDPERHSENWFDRGCRTGDSVMFLSCRLQIEYLRLVLQYGGNPNLVHPTTNAVPLDVAGERSGLSDSEARVALLLEHGADAKLTGRKWHPMFTMMAERDYESTIRLLRVGADPTRHGPERLQEFKDAIAKGLRECAIAPAGEKADRHAERCKYLAEIVEWMKSHGQEVPSTASPSKTEGEDPKALERSTQPDL